MEANQKAGLSCPRVTDYRSLMGCWRWDVTNRRDTERVITEAVGRAGRAGPQASDELRL